MTKKPDYIDPHCGLCHGKGRTKGHSGNQNLHNCPRCLGYGEFATPEAIAARKVREGARETKAKFSVSNKYAFVLKLCAHISGCTVEQVDAQIVKVMSENKWEDL